MKSEATASRWSPGSDSSWISDPGQALAGQGTGPDQLRPPTAIYVLVTGEIWRGIALLLCGAIGSVDNFVRPLVIGGRVEMPTFLLLFVLLGGLQVYGFLGIFVAPVAMAVLLALLEIYREHYMGEVPSAESG